jgi:hypothetical protein
MFIAYSKHALKYLRDKYIFNRLHEYYDFYFPFKQQYKHNTNIVYIYINKMFSIKYQGEGARAYTSKAQLSV